MEASLQNETKTEARKKRESEKGQRRAPRTKEEDSETFRHDSDAGGVGVIRQKKNQ
jgi:hypothetical protein